MKKKLLILFVTLTLNPSWLSQGQGLPYWSSLDFPVGDRAVSVGSDYWVARRFDAGELNDTPPGGVYRLESVQVQLTPGSDPTALRVMVYANDPTTYFPGVQLGAFSGPVAVEKDVATYRANSLSLQPATRYWLVFTATQPLADRTASLAEATDFINRNNWFFFASAESKDGLNWERGAMPFAQLALNATLIPEPSTLALFGLGGLLLLVRRSSCRNRP